MRCGRTSSQVDRSGLPVIQQDDGWQDATVAADHVLGEDGSPLFPADGSTSLRLALLDSETTTGAAHLRYRVISMESPQ
jgi:hypothetical protein